VAPPPAPLNLHCRQLVAGRWIAFHLANVTCQW
jgi:hypothetical protein